MPASKITVLYCGVDAAYQPGLLLLGIGVVLVLAGLFGQMVPRQHVWALVTPEGPLAMRLYAQSGGLDRRWHGKSNQAWENLRTTLDTTLEKAS